MARVAQAWNTGSGHKLPAVPRRILVVSVLAVAFVATTIVMIVTRSQEKAQIERIPQDERRALYARILADLELCATSAGSAMKDHCDHQAELILKFPECDVSCRRLAAPWQAIPVR